MKKRPSLSVGIPTCYGGDSLVATVKSLRASVGMAAIPITIVADRTPISQTIRKELKNLKVRLIWNDVEGSQFKKLKQLVSFCQSDIFVFTQDDITFHPKALREIYRAFEDDPKLTMVGARVLPLQPLTFFDSVMSVMVRMTDRIGRLWNRGDNHLLASGRCLAFRTSHLTKFRISDGVVNGDMYLYLENRRLGGKFRGVKEVEVYIRCPQTIKDQIGPSSRYQYSQEELSNYFPFDIRGEYRIPIHVVFTSAIVELFHGPLASICYAFVFVYTRLKRQQSAVVSNPVWKVDTSTKRV